MGTVLLKLMKKTSIETISIEEMTAKADVSRSAYFRYFKTKILLPRWEHHT
ncbi:transcriptional regulator [Clostridium sp. SY8519]|nr:transcriptional regulator [Clostridium sp. SY8519]